MTAGFKNHQGSLFVVPVQFAKAFQYNFNFNTTKTQLSLYFIENLFVAISICKELTN